MEVHFFFDINCVQIKLYLQVFTMIISLKLLLSFTNVSKHSRADLPNIKIEVVIWSLLNKERLQRQQYLKNESQISGFSTGGGLLLVQWQVQSDAEKWIEPKYPLKYKVLLTFPHKLSPASYEIKGYYLQNSWDDP